jgi:hypothetical protein
MMAYLTYPLMVLSLVVTAIAAWRVMRMGIITFVLLLPIVFALGMLFLIQGFPALGIGEYLTLLEHLFVGAGEPHARL